MELKLYSISEVAKILKLSRQRIDQFIQAGRLNCIWIGGTRVVSNDALDKFKKGGFTNTSEPTVPGHFGMGGGTGRGMGGERGKGGRGGGGYY